MRIEETKSVTTTSVQKVLIARRCDVCENQIDDDNYFRIETYHNDWRNDSIDSHEEYDACCPECVMKFTENYVKEAYANKYNTRAIEVEHVRGLPSGASDRW